MKLIILSLLTIQVVSSKFLLPCGSVERQRIQREAVEDVVRSLDLQKINDANRTCSNGVVVQEVRAAVEDASRNGNIGGCILPLLARIAEVLNLHGVNIVRRCPSNNFNSILRDAVSHTQSCITRPLASCASIRRCVADDNGERKEHIVQVVNEYTRCVLGECSGIQRDIQRIIGELRDCSLRTTLETSTPSNETEASSEPIFSNSTPNSSNETETSSGPTSSNSTLNSSDETVDSSESTSSNSTPNSSEETVESSESISPNSTPNSSEETEVTYD